MKATDIYSLLEAQQELFEVAMNPSNLRKLAAAIPGVQVGMEFEMVVPDASTGDDDYEAEPDYDQDERAEDIDDIVRFFGSDDDYMGRQNGPSELRDLEEELREKFYEWQSEQIDEEWNNDGKEFFARWVKDNVDPDDVADHVDKEEDLFGNRNPDGSDYMEFIEAEWEEGFSSDNYQRAYDEFREGRQDDGDFSERDFLRDIGIRDMSDVNNNIRGYINWPFYTQPYGDGGEDIESIGDDFSNAIGKRVYTSSSYHGARRGPDAYSLEPDSSIDASSGEAGLEFISPPMSVDEMFEDLKKVKEWADEKGCYTNRSTGLHINVSVPDYSLDKLDYVKLAVLLGDKYILEQFGRLSNSYAKSAIDIIKDRARDNEDVDRLLKQLKGNVETIASKILHSGRTDKFTSINTKDGYVEFRSAGGDWLNKNFDKIENTILRNVVALDAACDPNKYKKEYQKALYKLLKPKDDKSDMSMFARYMSGEITRSEYANTLESKRKERFRDQGIRILQKAELEENDWEITYDDGKTQDTIYIANTDKVADDQAAFNAAKKFKPQWFKPNTIEYITVKPFKYGEELNDLKLYRADYAHKYTSVVAKDHEQAKEYIKLMDPEWFSANPDTSVEFTDETASKRQISQMLGWQEGKISRGEEWIKRPKIWSARGTASEPAFANRYYIAAVTRDDALNVLKQLDPGFELRDLYVNDELPGENTYEAYKTAQEDLIRQQNEERAVRQAEQDETIDVSNLKGYRVSSMNGYMYVVAENGGEAAEIASKLDPAKFPNIADITVQDAGSIGAETLIRGMYARQQDQLSQLPAQQSAPKLEVNDRVEVASGYPSLIGMKGKVVQVSPNYEFVSVQLDGNNAPSSFPISSLKKVEEYTGYRVTGSNSSDEIIAAKTPEEAKDIARLLYPNLGTSLSVSATDMPPLAAAARYRYHQENIANLNNSSNNTNTQEEPRFKMYNVIGSNSSEHIAATSPEEAKRIAMLLYPHIGDILSTSNSNASPELAAARYMRHQEDIDRLNRAPSNTRISDLRYYRVTRQDASGRADVAASSPEDAMNRVRERNPTWANSPLRAELL